MLREILDVSQHPDEGKRRWFTDDYFDLIVWYDHKRKVSGFQLCYDTNKNERALTWKRNLGWSHDKVDSGEVTGRLKMSPILVADGLFPKEEIATRFRTASAEIDFEIAHFVAEKVSGYPSP